VEALILTADDPERGLLTTKTTAELCERLGLTRNEIQKMLYAARDAGLILGISCWKEREGNLLAQAATHWFIKPAETPSADVHTEGALERAPGEEEGALEGALEGAPGEVEGAHTRARVALLASSSSSYVEEVEVLSSTKSKQAELLERESLEGDDPFAVELGGGLLIDHTVTR